MKHPHVPFSSSGCLFPQWLPDPVWEHPKTDSTGHCTKLHCLWGFTWTRVTVQYSTVQPTCSPEALWKYKHKIQTIFSQKKRVKLTAFSCGCCKRQSFQTGLVWNTEKWNPSQGQKKQFNLHNCINRLEMCFLLVEWRYEYLSDSTEYEKE